MTELEWLTNFGDNLKSMMYESGMNQSDLSKESGLSKSMISRFIRKETIPSLKSVINLAYALDCNINDLIDFGEQID